jgi:hypothetical protein
LRSLALGATEEERGGGEGYESAHEKVRDVADEE